MTRALILKRLIKKIDSIIMSFFQKLGDVVNPFDGNNPLLNLAEQILPGENRLINGVQDALDGNGFNWGANNLGNDGQPGSMAYGGGALPPSGGTCGPPLDCYDKCAQAQSTKETKCQVELAKFILKLEQMGCPGVTCNLPSGIRTCGPKAMIAVKPPCGCGGH